MLLRQVRTIGAPHHDPLHASPQHVRFDGFLHGEVGQAETWYLRGCCPLTNDITSQENCP